MTRYATSSTAIHEAGHVLQSLLLAQPFKSVSIISDEGSRGYVANRKSFMKLDSRSRVSFFMAGCAAQAALEQKCRPYFIIGNSNFRSDKDTARLILCDYFSSSQEMEKEILEVTNEVYERFLDPYLHAALDKIAGLIEDYREMTFDDLAKEFEYSYYRSLINNCKKPIQ